jgi:integrase
MDDKSQKKKKPINLILWSQENTSGKFQVKIRKALANNKYEYVSVLNKEGKKIALEEGFWDADENRPRTNCNQAKEIMNFFYTYIEQEETLTIEEKRNLIANRKTTLFYFMNFYLDYVKESRKTNYYNSVKSVFTHLKEIQKHDIDISEADELFFIKFKNHFKKLERSNNTINNYLDILKSFLNHINRFFKLRLDLSFFSHLSEKKDEKKVKLNKDFDSLIHRANRPYSLVLLTKIQFYHLNTYLTAFYLAGMRMGDVFRLKFSNFSTITEDRQMKIYLNYKMQKSQQNIELMVADVAFLYLARYLDKEYQEMIYEDTDDAIHYYLTNNVSREKFKNHFEDIIEAHDEYLEDDDLDEVKSPLEKKIELCKICFKLQLEKIKKNPKSNRFLTPDFKIEKVRPKIIKKKDFNNEEEVVSKYLKSLITIANDNYKKISEKFKICHFSSHSARHQTSYVLNNGKCSHTQIQQVLGHQSVLTTESYLTRFKTDVISEQVNSLLDEY